MNRHLTERKIDIDALQVVLTRPANLDRTRLRRTTGPVTDSFSITFEPTGDNPRWGDESQADCGLPGFSCRGSSLLSEGGWLRKLSRAGQPPLQRYFAKRFSSFSRCANSSFGTTPPSESKNFL